MLEWKMLIGPRPDVQGYADQLKGDDREVLKLRPGITGPATLKYRLEDEMISEYVAKKQAAGDTRPVQVIAEEYNDKVIYHDKVRINLYYLHHYSFIKDIQMIFCTVLSRKMHYANQTICFFISFSNIFCHIEKVLLYLHCNLSL